MIHSKGSRFCLFIYRFTMLYKISCLGSNNKRQIAVAHTALHALSLQGGLNLYSVCKDGVKLMVKNSVAKQINSRVFSSIFFFHCEALL